jgi:hypothetical protein
VPLLEIVKDAVCDEPTAIVLTVVSSMPLKVPPPPPPPLDEAVQVIVIETLDE